MPLDQTEPVESRYDDPPVSRAQGARLLVAAATLSDAFASDPLFVWFMRDDSRREVFRARFFERIVTSSAAGGAEVWTTDDGAGAALWVPPPGPAPMGVAEEVALLPLLLGVTGWARFGRLVALRKAMARAKDGRPSAYLSFLGVRADRQGKGLGSRLLDAALAPMDATGTAATLETATPANLPLYRSRGFQITREFRAAPDSPVIWAMRREPRLV